MIVYDYEVVKYDWLIVAIDTSDFTEYVIHNEANELTKLHEKYENDIWCGYNNRHYDQYIHKGILLGLNPKEINDWIIEYGKEGWQFTSAFNQIRMINYDVMTATGRVGLKTIEAFLYDDITETEVPFDIDRPLTEEEVQNTIKYCRMDVMQTIRIMTLTSDVWDATKGIINAFPDMVSIRDIGDSESRLTAKVLGCIRREYKDEFDFAILPCIQLKKYKFVADWFVQIMSEAKALDFENENEKRSWYKSKSLTVEIAGIPHTFGFGGLHGAEDKPVHMSHKDGAGYHVDVNNYYPSMLIAWNLVTRAATNNNYTTVYSTRKKLKMQQLDAAKRNDKDAVKKFKKAQLPYKKMLNALSGAMKDATNPAYDPRNNNLMCINGQLMLLDLIEHLEVIPGFRLIQSNTDGLIIWLPDTDEAFESLDDICYEWEQRCSTDNCDIGLALDCIDEIYQRDVNNYLWIDVNGEVERIGAVKPLSPIDNDLPIVNKAVVDYMVHKTPVKDTVYNCNEFGMFQKIVKLSSLYNHVEHEHCIPDEVTTGVRVKKTHYVYKNTDRYVNKSYRVFASTDMSDGRILKIRDGERSKFANTPDHCFIHNESVEGMTVPQKLDRQYYIDKANKILAGFGERR